MVKYVEESATPSDRKILTDLYLNALKESLTAINRFNEEDLARQFMQYYDEFRFIKVLVKNEVAGFYSIKHMPDHIWLVHFYIDPKYQSMGMGTKLLEKIISDAKAIPLPIRLIAIEKSPANAFYLKRGFKLDHSDGTNNHYLFEHH